MRGNIQWYKVLQDKELKQVEGQSEAVRRQELQRQIQDLRAELTHLDSQISGTEAQLVSEEQSVDRSWAAVQESLRRELLLRAFRQRCATDRQRLSDDTRKISGHCQALEQLARKAEVEVFGSDASHSSGGDTLRSAAAEPRVLCEVRDLCEERRFFFQSLQESELKTQASSASHMTREERTSVFQHWLSTVEDLLQGYPPNQVLSALQHLAQSQGAALEEKLASLDVARDVEALRFRYESDHLLDVSRQEEEELPPVKTLLQAAWEEVEESLTELTQTRSRIQELQNQLQAHRKEAGLEMTAGGQESQNDSLSQSALDVEQQAVMRAALRDSVRDQCQLMDQQARERQEALRNLQSQWQSILDFRQLVDARQEQIRGLIKANSSAKTELTRQHKEVGLFYQSKLTPEFSEVITATNGLRNSVSQDVRQFGAVSLSALDRRVVEGGERIPASSLSIHRPYSPAFHSLCQSLDFPLYKAPEELCAQVLSQHLELRYLRGLLQVHSTSLENITRQEALLPAPDQQALRSRVVEEDGELLQSLLPRIRTLSQSCTRGLDYGTQVKTAISHWWDQPAQLALPDMRQSGKTLQQWLQRWKLAAKDS